MPHAWRSGVDAPCTSAATSGGSRRCCVTYSSNIDSALRDSSATPSPGSETNGCGRTSARSDLALPRNFTTRARARPSTSTRAAPFGSRVYWSTRASVPVRNRSAAAGSCTLLSFCATSSTSLSEASAASRAASDPGRPTSSGMATCGNSTTSRSGSTGSRLADSMTSESRMNFWGIT